MRHEAAGKRIIAFRGVYAMRLISARAAAAPCMRVYAAVGRANRHHLSSKKNGRGKW